ncbi:MAG: hypothetical protein ACMUIM_03320 [bacterium]
MLLKKEKIDSDELKALVKEGSPKANEQMGVIIFHYILPVCISGNVYQRVEIVRDS